MPLLCYKTQVKYSRFWYRTCIFMCAVLVSYTQGYLWCITACSRGAERRRAIYDWQSHGPQWIRPHSALGALILWSTMLALSRWAPCLRQPWRILRLPWT